MRFFRINRVPSLSPWTGEIVTIVKIGNLKLTYRPIGKGFRFLRKGEAYIYGLPPKLMAEWLR